MSDFKDLIRKGQFSKIINWLSNNVHKLGSLYHCSKKLLNHVTGKELDLVDYETYLKTKFL